MAIKQLKDGRWICYYNVREEGKIKRKKEYFGRGQKGEIAAKARDAQLKEERGNDNVNMSLERISPSFRDLAVAYTEAKFTENGEMSAGDQTATYYRMKANILPFFGEKRATKISDAEIRSYITKRRKDGVKNSTVRRELSIVKAVLNWAVKHRPPLIPFNPVRDYPLPKRDDEIITPPTNSEIERLIKTAPPHLERILILSFFTGVRPGAAELYSIDWENVNFEQNHIRVISAHKGGPKYRDVPMAPPLRKKLMQWRQEDAQTRGVPEVELYGPIITYRGKPLKSNFRKSFSSALRRAKIRRRIRPYDLRHAFVSRILEEGGDLKAVSKMIGHSRPDTTLRVYQHVPTKLEHKAVSKLPELNLVSNQGENSEQ